MNGGLTFTANVHFGTGRRSRKELKAGEKPVPPQDGFLV